MALEKELETYRKHLPELKADAGKFVVISGDDVAGIYTAYEDAIKAAYEKFSLTPFLVKRIEAEETVQHFTRLLDTCPS